jgi:holliday junction DNA helicase RuvA
MFHYFHWSIQQFGDQTYIINDTHGIQIHYKSGANHKGVRWLFIHPHIDDNHKTIRYYGFDTHEQKHIFENLLKISGIWPKTAFHIAQIPQKDIQQATQDLNIKFFQNIPGIGPKSAKKILLELKDSIKQDDLQKLAIDDKLLKKITTTLKWLGYEAKKINEVLHKYDKPITEDNLSEVVKWIIKQI